MFCADPERRRDYDRGLYHADVGVDCRGGACFGGRRRARGFASTHIGLTAAGYQRRSVRGSAGTSEWESDRGRN